MMALTLLRPGMRGRCAALLVGVALLAPLPGRAAETNAVSTLEGLVRQWVDLRGAVAAEVRARDEQERQLQSEARLLEKERAALQSERDGLAAELRRTAQEQQDQAERESKLRAALGAFNPSLERAEADLTRWRARIPEPLAAPLAADFAKLSGTNDPSAGAVQRLQIALGLYGQIEDLQRNVHVVKQLLPEASGSRREMDVLYLGLARAFAVSSDGAQAAVGVPGTDGWRWESRPALAHPIRAVIESQGRSRRHEVAALPLGVVEVSP